MIIQLQVLFSNLYCRKPQCFQVGDDIVKGTSQWKGIRVTVKLTIQKLGIVRFHAPLKPSRSSGYHLGMKIRIRSTSIKHPQSILAPFSAFYRFLKLCCSIRFIFGGWWKKLHFLRVRFTYRENLLHTNYCTNSTWRLKRLVWVFSCYPQHQSLLISSDLYPRKSIQNPTCSGSLSLMSVAATAWVQLLETQEPPGESGCGA